MVLMLIYSTQNIDIIATYSNNYGAVRSSRVKMGDLSASWVLENPIDGRHGHPKSLQVLYIRFLVIEIIDVEGTEKSDRIQDLFFRYKHCLIFLVFVTFQIVEDSFQSGMRFKEKTEHSADDPQSGEGEIPYSRLSSISPVKHKRRVNCQMLFFCLHYVHFVQQG